MQPGHRLAGLGGAALLAPLLAAALVGGCADGDEPGGLDRFGGFRAIATRATGRFRTERIDGTWWLVTPEGHGFFSAGVNHVTPEGDYAPALGRSPYRDAVLARYGSEAAWADVVLERYRDLGLTTIGAWSQLALFRGRFPYTPILSFADRAPAVPGVPAGVTGRRVRDYFAPEFAAGAAAEAESARDCAGDEFCVGVFSDNELGFGRGVVQVTASLDAYLQLPPGAPGKLALQAFFEERYAGDIAAFDAVWGQTCAAFSDLQALAALPASAPGGAPARSLDRQAFEDRVGRKYFEVVHGALRAVDPQLLFLGSRFVLLSTSPGLLAAAAELVDVVSVNQYDIDDYWRDALAPLARQNGYIATADLFTDLDEFERVAGKPILLTEFSYRAADAGLPNTYPPIYPTLATQAERADRYESYMRRTLGRPYLVGAHWFEHADQPAEGRFDGENNNFGLVDLRDDLYPELTERMRAVNHGVLASRGRR